MKHLMFRLVLVLMVVLTVAPAVYAQGGDSDGDDIPDHVWGGIGPDQCVRVLSVVAGCEVIDYTG